MKKALIGFALGIALSCALVVFAMSDGKPFRSMVVKHGVENGAGIVATEKFVVLFAGVDKDDAGACTATYAGKYGTLPAVWSGYSSGWTGDQTGISSYHTYEPNQGTALLFYFGRLILLEETGQYLRVQNKRFALGDKTVVVSVGADGVCKSLSDVEARKIYDSLDGWYKDPTVSAKRPANHAVERTAGLPAVAHF